ncbi:MAG: SMP-30/gluconolactonase/LRE family protein [Bacteroides sp.]|jgi:gluconolactonase|nr:SMP-30/gluconolactonase/LRE family protein [Bacteroides sp.]
MKNLLVILVAFLLFPFFSCNNSKKADSSEDNNKDPLAEQFKIAVYDSLVLTMVEPDAPFEILAKGFWWSEGPVWVDDLKAVLFSDVPANKIYRWSEQDSLGVYLASAGHSGPENKDSGLGSNGLLLDPQNRLIVCQHGDRRIARMEADLNDPQADFTTLAGSYGGKQFNSPNDLTIDQAGNVYFTDPPYGRPGNETGEIGINGVYKVSPDGVVSLLLDSLSMPNGIALSPDENTVYINQSNPDNPVLYRYAIAADGSLENGKVLFDFLALSENAEGLPDGLKVHQSGNIFATGPGGVHIISPDGKHLGLIHTLKATSNCAFDTEQKYLYMTTSDVLIRVRIRD